MPKLKNSFLPICFFSALLFFANLSKAQQEIKPSFTFKTIVIDAGHGGKDPGAHGIGGRASLPIQLRADPSETPSGKKPSRVSISSPRPRPANCIFLRSAPAACANCLLELVSGLSSVPRSDAEVKRECGEDESPMPQLPPQL